MHLSARGLEIARLNAMQLALVVLRHRAPGQLCSPESVRDTAQELLPFLTDLRVDPNSGQLQGDLSYDEEERLISRRAEVIHSAIEHEAWAAKAPPGVTTDKVLDLAREIMRFAQNSVAPSADSVDRPAVVRNPRGFSFSR